MASEPWRPFRQEATPKYQYFGSADDLDFDAAIQDRGGSLHELGALPAVLQEDSDAGIAFVQTSAKLVTSRESSTLVVSADGTVQSGSAAAPTVSSSHTSFAVSADGRMHVEM